MAHDRRFIRGCGIKCALDQGQWVEIKNSALISRPDDVL